MDSPPHAITASWREQALAGLQRGDMALAEQAFSRLLEVQPDDAQALQFLATCQLSRGHAARAIELLLAAQRSMPRDAAILHQLGSAQMLAGDLQTAEDNLRKACSSRPACSWRACAQAWCSSSRGARTRPCWPTSARSMWCKRKGAGSATRRRPRLCARR